MCAVEPSEPFADACRARLPGVEVVVARAEALPFAGRVFDATLSQLVVNFMADPEAGVREMARVTRPGGVVAACVWDYAGEMTLLRAFWDAAREVDRRSAPRPSTRAPSCAGAPTASWPGCGARRDWRTCARAALVVRAAYADFEDLWSPLPTGVGPSGAFCARSTTTAAPRCATPFGAAWASGRPVRAHREGLGRGRGRRAGAVPRRRRGS